MLPACHFVPLTRLLTRPARSQAEDRIWDNPTKLTATAHLAIRSGVPEHRVAHMITRAKQLEANEGVRRSPRPHSAYAAGSPRGSPSAQVWSVGRDDAHEQLHDGMTFVTGASHNLREPHRGGSGQFGSSPSRSGKPSSPRRGHLGSREQRGGPKGTQIDFYETRGSGSGFPFDGSSGTFYPEAEPAGAGDNYNHTNSAARLRSEVSAARLGVDLDGEDEKLAAVTFDFLGRDGAVRCRVVPMSPRMASLS